ncbi:MAG: DUF447 domain-containing protein [Gemmataceae bacterium]
MILEGIVTTLSSSGEMHVAPMGPRVEPAMDRFLLRPFPSSQTYQNLRRDGEGVFHVTDDVLLLAQAAVGRIDPPPPHFPAAQVKASVLAEACRFYEFRVSAIDDREQRVRIDVDVVHSGRLRDFIGFNRAKHAVVEAAILATRIDILPHSEIVADYRRLAVLVEKTGGPREIEAFSFLEAYLDEVMRSRAENASKERA